MPLPPALLAKLSKRGIVRQDGDEVEEVIAESYDDKEAEDHSLVATATDDSNVKLIFEVADCPNASNRYHECSQFCKDKHGLKSFTHVKGDLPKKERLLNKYPLPSGWTEVGDPDTGRCYYWNMDTDKVSWLPPQHPKAKITVSAEKLQSNLRLATGKREPAADSNPKPAVEKKKKSVNISAPESKRKRREMSDELDPMDPASYSEVERGTWSTGLKEDTKTGVDKTASGPLFQQRPYPSPGEILRAQAAAKQSN